MSPLVLVSVGALVAFASKRMSAYMNRTSRAALSCAFSSLFSVDSVLRGSMITQPHG